MRRALFLLACVTIGMMVFLQLRVDGSGFTSDPKEIEEIDRRLSLQGKSMREITIREANLFHKQFVETCMENLPREITLQYIGNLGADNGRHKQRILTDEVTAVLHWNVQDHSVRFSFWISTMETKDTLARCSIEKPDIFVNVDFVDGDRSVNQKLPELGNQSVKDVLYYLNLPRAKE